MIEPNHRYPAGTLAGDLERLRAAWERLVWDLRAKVNQAIWNTRWGKR